VKNTFASIATPLIEYRIQNGRKKSDFITVFHNSTFLYAI